MVEFGWFALVRCYEKDDRGGGGKGGIFALHELELQQVMSKAESPSSLSLPLCFYSSLEV